ncbi:hypothetical protein PR202_ga19775 [Eleusine coracana subsp. coracana]|uniref:Uncharacterized protein n=1 Tax=Eleusine coracana subsp. coracana TaxID=191504 RepID=A0AAV5CXA9_ELECO|nr:hypothetical protein PR202_ga19775 [Eleusine coracana subsp. coracana]
MACGGRVRFNVGGQVFETTTTTLANAGRDSMLGALLDSSWNLPSSSSTTNTGGGVPEYFIDRNPSCFALMSRKVLLPGEESCYPRLATHGGQLFSSMNDSVSVFSGPEFVLTSTLRRSHGGAICDFSIGGDRLFVLHNEENVFDVWETPPPPII